MIIGGQKQKQATNHLKKQPRAPLRLSNDRPLKMSQAQYRIVIYTLQTLYQHHNVLNIFLYSMIHVFIWDLPEKYLNFVNLHIQNYCERPLYNTCIVGQLH